MLKLGVENARPASSGEIRPADVWARYADDRTKLLQEKQIAKFTPQMRWLPIASCFHLQRISRFHCR